MSQLYVFIAIIFLAVIAFFRLKSSNGKKQKKLSTLAAIAFSLVIAGLVFGENRWVGYSLIGAGIILALVDMWDKQKKHQVK